MNKFYFFCFIFFTIVCSCQSNKMVSEAKGKSNEDFQKIYPLALRGELPKVLEILDTITLSSLNNNEKAIRQNYYNRFVNDTETYGFKTKDESIIQFVKLFQDYWKVVLKDEQTMEIADSLLKKHMTKYLLPHFKKKKVSATQIEEDLYTYFNEYLKDKGYFSNAFGKTAHFYDLFLWKNEEVKIYPIALIEDSVQVPVHFMKDFIATGWSHYATFGRNYASGWATKEALYAVDTAYDRTTENFKVSYLTHEGQHFLDYKKFPKLQQADLEYRAKLVELVKSDSTTLDIVGKFIRNSSPSKENAHGFANHSVIRDLSKLLFKKEFITKKEIWTSIDADRIKKKSELLFKQHTSKLMEVGADTVTKLIAL